MASGEEGLEYPPEEPTAETLPVLPAAMHLDDDFTEIWETVHGFYQVRDAGPRGTFFTAAGFIDTSLTE